MSKFDYKDLAPINNIESGKEYIEALDWALNNPKVKNIALAGPYGSGKSSIIDSYLEFDQNNNSERKSKNLMKTSLKISMAKFEMNDSKVDIDADEVEQGILKQLFYKVKNGKLPQSRYRKLHVQSFRRIYFRAFLCLIISLLYIRIFFFEKYSYIYNSIVNFLNDIGCFGVYPIFSYGLLLFLIFIVSGAISYLWYWGTNKYYLKQVNIIANAEIEANYKNEESIFNKNLDEIMYFFEATEYRTIFFEDLDRLDDKKIFLHLRELNNLLNNDDNIKEKPVVFIYAIKDDIFSTEDRTKFFDFIIPVIPVINSTNSGEILLNKLKESEKNNRKYDISENFVLDVSPYISDMRILQNIYNEFVIYKKTIKDTQGLSLSDEQMMAMIIFKNLCPSDFADMQAEKGIIKEVFENKETYIRKKQAELQEKIDNFKIDLENARVDNLHSIRELKVAMFSEIVEYNGYFKSIRLPNYTIISATDILQDEFKIESLKDYNNCMVSYYGFNSMRENNFQVNNFKQKILPYIKRWNNLKLLDQEKLSELQNENECNKKLLHALAGMSIASIITENEDFKFSDSISRNKLLVFLLRRGYIDENYANYINYFRNSSVTTKDMNFILSVKNREPKPFNYNLTKTNIIVQRLQNYEFEQKEIYNFSLFEYLLKSKEKEKLNIFIKQLSDESDRSWKFIDEFFDRIENKQEFISLLADRWTGIWEYISKKDDITYSKQLQYLILIINSEKNLLKKCNQNNAIKNYMENHPDILRILSESVPDEKLCVVINELNLFFKNLEFTGVSNYVLDCICDNRHYDLNERMIRNVVMHKNKMLSYNLRSKPYTTVIELEYKELTNYIKESFEYYLNHNIFTKKVLNDDLKDILDMLSRVITKNEYYTKIIVCEQLEIENIRQVLVDKIENYKNNVNDIWNALLMNNKIIPTWENIVAYWKEFSLSQCLIEYIKRNIKVLESANTQACTDNFIVSFINANCNDEVYRKLLPVMHMKSFNIPLEKLSNELLKLMIEIKYFDFTLERYAYIEQIDHDFAIDYIVNNQNAVINLIAQFPMTNGLLDELLANNSIEQKNKEMLCNYFAQKFMGNNIVKRILATKININKDCFKLAWNDATEEEKEQLMLEYFKLLNNDDLEKCFTELGGKYEDFKKRNGRYTVKLKYTEKIIKLVKYLKESGYITSYKINDQTNENSNIILCKLKKI